MTAAGTTLLKNPNERLENTQMLRQSALPVGGWELAAQARAAFVFCWKVSLIPKEGLKWCRSFIKIVLRRKDWSACVWSPPCPAISSSPGGRFLSTDIPHTLIAQGCLLGTARASIITKEREYPLLSFRKKISGFQNRVIIPQVFSQPLTTAWICSPVQPPAQLTPVLHVPGQRAVSCNWKCSPVWSVSMLAVMGSYSTQLRFKFYRLCKSSEPAEVKD